MWCANSKTIYLFQLVQMWYSFNIFKYVNQMTTLIIFMIFNKQECFLLLYVFYLFLSLVQIYEWIYVLYMVLCTYFISIYNLHIVTYYYIGNAYTLVYKNTHENRKKKIWMVLWWCSSVGATVALIPNSVDS